MKHLTPVSVAALISVMSLGQAASAGNIAEPVVEAPVFVPEPVIAQSDWTGFYTGLQLGYSDLDGPDTLDGNDNSFGVHAGYDYDFGQYVLGAELDYDQTDVNLGDGLASVDSVARAKLKAGYDLGSTLVYATGGMARADTSLGNETGPFLGLGVTYKMTERYTVGAEVLEHRFDDVGGVAGNDIDATTFSLRGSIRF